MPALNPADQDTLRIVSHSYYAMGVMKFVVILHYALLQILPVIRKWTFLFNDLTIEVTDLASETTHTSVLHGLGCDGSRT
ncbi:hypothetical protein D3C86_2059480 [compost metagenome]